MKRFRLKLIVLLLSVIVVTVGDTLLFVNGKYPEGIILAVLLLCLLIAVWTFIRQLILVMSNFVAALEMNDSTTKFDDGGDDADLRGMFRAMNRIVSLYRSNARQLETSKLYYDRILKVMTHEMRNSITPVIAIASDMENSPGKYSSDTLKEAVSVIRNQSEGIKRFLDSYYRLTHVPVPEMVAVDAVQFFERVKTLIAVDIRERGMDEGVCRFAVGQGMTLCIDTSLMTQVMINMLRNALDAVKDEANPDVEVSVSESEGSPYIRIADNGTGLSPAIRDMLFQPFATTKPSGSGVGLFLSRQIVRQHGGDLRITDNPHKGATVIITL